MEALVAAGSLSKAAQELSSGGLHKPREAISAKLRQLHTQAALPAKRAISSELPSLDEGNVRSALNSFHVASAPGPSGMRVDHLQDCLMAASSAAKDALLKHLTRFVNLAASGALPAEHAQLLIAARLVPFKKSDGAGVRPIAMREGLRRLVVK